MLNFFRTVSILEGFSYLSILGVAFGVISRDYVFPIGMAHGVFFMTYIFTSVSVCHKLNWSIFKLLLLFVASIVPFGFVPVEMALKKALPQQQPALNT